MRSISSSKISGSAQTRRWTRPGSTSLAISSACPLRMEGSSKRTLFRCLVGVALHLHVDELERRGSLLEHAPALEPIVGALHLLERDRRRIADHEAARAKVLDLQRGDLRIGGA